MAFRDTYARMSYVDSGEAERLAGSRGELVMRRNLVYPKQNRQELCLSRDQESALLLSGISVSKVGASAPNLEDRQRPCRNDYPADIAS